MVADVVNPLALRQRQEIRERLAAAKEKRLQNQKLGCVFGGGGVGGGPGRGLGGLWGGYGGLEREREAVGGAESGVGLVGGGLGGVWGAMGGWRGKEK